MIDKNIVAANFGAATSSYESVTPVQEKMAANLVQQISKRRENHQINNILEIGCGTGRLTRKLRLVFPKTKITAIDISEEMVAHAKQSCAEVDYIVADAEEYIYQFKNNFDLIVSSAAIQWFDQPNKTLTQIYRLLAPKGLLAIATFAERTFMELADAFKNAYNSNQQIVRSHIVPMRPVSVWKNEFPDMEINEEDIRKIFPDVRSFLRSIQEAGAVNSTVQRTPIPKQVLKSMIEYYSKYYSLPNSSEVWANYHICYLFRERTSEAL